MVLTPPTGRLSHWLSVGVLTSSVPRDVIDQALTQHGKQAKRSDGKLPPHVMVYFAMALALFSEKDYEEVITRLSEPLALWGCREWQAPTRGGITQARQRLGWRVMETIFDQIAARPVAGALNRTAWLGPLRLVSIDGMVLDVPDTGANAAAFGSGDSAIPSTSPQVRVVTLNECGSHAPLAAALGPGGDRKGAEERPPARALYPRLEHDMLLLADHRFSSCTDFDRAADTGAHLLWRVKDEMDLPVVEFLPDGSYLSVITRARPRPVTHQRPARMIRVIEYEVDQQAAEPERICLLTTLTDPLAMPAPHLAQAYDQRWKSECANAELKSSLGWSGRVLRSRSPDMVRQEIYGYLLTHRALSSLLCQAATEADVVPDQAERPAAWSRPDRKINLR